MGISKKTIKNPKKVFFLILVFLPILCTIAIIDILYSNLSEIEKEVEVNTSTIIESKRDNTQYLVRNKISRAKIQNKYLEAYINHLIAEDPSILDDLSKIDTDSSISPKAKTALTKIYNYDNHISSLLDVVVTDSIILINSPNGIIRIDDSGGSSQLKFIFISWRDVIESKKNKALAESVVQHIKTKDTTVLFWESDTGTTQLTNSYVYSSRDTLKQILRSITETSDLSNYNLLIPAYYKVGNESFKINNDISIIREINLHDIIIPYLSNITRYDEILDEYQNDMNHLTMLTQSLGIFLIIILASCIIIGVVSASGYVKPLTLHKQQQDRDNNGNQ